MEKFIKCVLISTMLFSVAGCSSTNEVAELMENGDYYGAEELILEDDKKYGEYKDECFYNIALDKINNYEYVDAYDYLVDIDYEDSADILESIMGEYNNEYYYNLVLEKFDNLTVNIEVSNNDERGEGSDLYESYSRNIENVCSDLKKGNVSQEDLESILFEVSDRSSDNLESLNKVIENKVIDHLTQK